MLTLMKEPTLQHILKCFFHDYIFKGYAIPKAFQGKGIDSEKLYTVSASYYI